MVKPASATATAAPVSVRNTAGGGVAKLGDRFIAFVLDTVVLFGLFIVVDAWVFMRWGAVEGAEMSLTTAALLTEQRMIFDRSYPAPDFVCEGLTGSLFVESVTVIPSRRGDIVVEPMRAILRNSSSTSRITCP